MEDKKIKEMDNFETAKKIINMLGIEKNDPGILRGLMDACADCEKYGPSEGKPCMSLRLALDMGVEYTPPDWCRDKNVMANRTQEGR